MSRQDGPRPAMLPGRICDAGLKRWAGLLLSIALTACATSPGSAPRPDGGADVVDLKSGSGDDGIACTPKCLKRVCGFDGCGGSCGACSQGTCNLDGQCVSVCVPNCSGRQCGPDPVCGTSCGACATGSCNAAGQCVSACVPNCSGRQCGPDPVCGTSCGTCATGSCNAAGQCVSACVPNCTGRQCGPDPVCGTSCGTCNGTCDTAGQCTCVPTKSCASLGAQCSSVFDGCKYTYCGVCAALQSCAINTCLSQTDCHPSVVMLGSCLIKDGAGNPLRCWDVQDNFTDGSASAAYCTSSGGVWTSGAACSHVNSAGGCRNFSAANVAHCETFTTWIYAATVHCSAPDVFVAPRSLRAALKRRISSSEPMRIGRRRSRP